MKNPNPFRRVDLDKLDHDDTVFVLMRRDAIHAGRIYISFPRCASMTEQQAIELANAIADTIEER